MDISFDIKSAEGDLIRVALSYYDAESVGMFSSNPSILSLVFYDVTLIRVDGDKYIGYKILSAVSDTLARFLNENEDAVLCFYCDDQTDVARNHKDISPQEYRSRLFSGMFDRYMKFNNELAFVNRCVKIEDSDDSNKSRFAHFICRKEHESSVIELGNLLMEK